MSRSDSIEKLSRMIDSSGLFTQSTESVWVNQIYCEICLETHDLQRVIVSEATTHNEQPLTSLVRLSDGIHQVDITFDPPCIDQPFINASKVLSKALQLPILSEHQIFDSLEHLYESLRFSVGGIFFAWDEPLLEIWEEHEHEMGHLLKVNYRQSRFGQLLDVIFEFEEFKEVRSNYQGTKVKRFGVEITISGGDSDQIVQVANDFQTVLDDYAQLLAPKAS